MYNVGAVVGAVKEDGTKVTPPFNIPREAPHHRHHGKLKHPITDGGMFANFRMWKD